DGQGNGVVGAATVTATAAVGVSAIFTVYDANGNYMTEAGVGSSQPAATVTSNVPIGASACWFPPGQIINLPSSLLPPNLRGGDTSSWADG
ncbi:MAG TPA: hypothetical protein VE398_17630, partial [Acidobacteriota bacterium]|nr:hypothetical protein [Acidobacteriota bacterium]